jgi:peptide/nickel transport system permease protein
MRLIPGDAALARVARGGNFSPERLDIIRHQLGIDRSFIDQFADWLIGIPQGDFGRSFASNKPAFDEFWKGVPITLELGLIALFTAVAIAVPVGTISALRQDTWIDYLGRGIAVIGISVPVFFLGILLIVYPSIWFNWVWPRGTPSLFDETWTNLKAFVVPGFILGFASSAYMMRLLRTSVLEAMRQDYVRTARAKGLSGRVVVIRHVLRNALLPTVTLIGAQLGALLGGAVIIEQLFGLPGVGFRTFNAVGARDYPLLQVTLLVLGAVIVLMNVITDLTYAWLDPRIKYSGSGA